MSVGMDPATRAHTRRQEPLMDDEGLSTLTRHYERLTGTKNHNTITAASELPYVKQDAKSHAALEDSRSFAPDIEVDKGVYQGPKLHESKYGLGIEEDGCGPFRLDGPHRGYSAGR